MFLTIDDRLACVSRALEAVIIPALPPDQMLAIEQAHLSVMHIRALLGQATELSAAVDAELQDATSLRDQLCEVAELQGEKPPHSSSSSSVPEPYEKILADVANRIRQISAKGDEQQWLAMRAPIIRHARARAQAEAYWFADFGMPSLDNV